MLRKFLAATICLQEALPIGDFARLSGIPETSAEEIHQRLAALRTQGDPKTDLILPAIEQFHASFVEFMTAESDDQTFQAISVTNAHCMLAKRCLGIVFVELLPSLRGKTCTYTDLRRVELYTIKYWPLHLSSGTTSQALTPPSSAVGLDLISEEAMHRWATLFLPCIASRFQDGHDSLDGIERSMLLKKLAAVIGRENLTTLSYHIHCLKIATQLQPLDLRTWKLLGFAYIKLYEHSQSKRDLDEEITALRSCLEPASHADRPMSLNFLALALQTRFNVQGISKDLDEAILLHQEALLLFPALHPDRPNTLNNLGWALQVRFKQRGSSNDLDETVSLFREALLLCPTPHSARFASINNLGISLETRFEQRGSSDDLEESILLHRKALLLCPEPHLDRSMSLNNLANSLITRFEQLGTSNDIDEAVSFHREALRLRPERHKERSQSLNNLATALHSRFDLRGASDDIDEAISLHREALISRPESHTRRANSLNNLATALQTRFRQRGSSNDLDEAISLHREALHLRPEPHTHRSSSLNNLATSLQTRFLKRGSSNDLDEAILLFREALLLFPGTHPLYSKRLKHLAVSLRLRFVYTHLQRDLTETISLYEQLIKRPAADPNRVWALEQLPSALQKRDELVGAHGDNGVEGANTKERSSVGQVAC